MSEGTLKVGPLRRVARANRRWLLPLLERLECASLRAAAREQGLAALTERLAGIVPDLTDQYTTLRIDREMLRVKVRIQHAFQIRLALEAVARELGTRGARTPEQLSVVDVGDSAGSHLLYLKTLLAGDERLGTCRLECLAVNVDPAAVARVRSRGVRAVEARAEMLHERGIDADLMLSFEMLEHLPDPIAFLDSVSRHSRVGHLVVTVPYLTKSRVGLHHIRHGRRHIVYAENTHIFELSPDDWRLLFAHSGWAVVDEQVYRQYPRRSIWRVLAPVWRALDFEGFYGAILRRDRTWADCYRSDS